MNLILMGAPGAGKGTHAKVIVAKFDIPHISTGDILREEVAKGTDLGITAKSYMDVGKLLPDDIIIRIIKMRLQEDDCRNGFLFDGFPRTIVQSEMLDKIANIEAVIYLKCDDDILLKRLTGRRMTEDGKRVTMDIKVGDAVIYAKYGGMEIKIDDEELIILRESDILAKKTK